MRSTSELQPVSSKGLRSFPGLASWVRRRNPECGNVLFLPRIYGRASRINGQDDKLLAKKLLSLLYSASPLPSQNTFPTFTTGMGKLLPPTKQREGREEGGTEPLQVEEEEKEDVFSASDTTAARQEWNVAFIICSLLSKPFVKASG